MEYVAEPIDRTAPWMRISLGMMRFACDTSELLADVIRRVGVIIAIVGAVVDAPSGTSETARETGHCRPRVRRGQQRTSVLDVCGDRQGVQRCLVASERRSSQQGRVVGSICANRVVGLLTRARFG